MYLLRIVFLFLTGTVFSVGPFPPVDLPREYINKTNVHTCTRLATLANPQVECPSTTTEQRQDQTLAPKGRAHNMHVRVHMCAHVRACACIRDGTGAQYYWLWDSTMPPLGVQNTVLIWAKKNCFIPNRKIAPSLYIILLHIRRSTSQCDL